jgi:hypothetical protein
MCLIGLALSVSCGKPQTGETTPKLQRPAVELTDAQMKTLVNRSYQYVSLYNVNNKIAMKNAIRTTTTGWNVCVAHTELADHNLRSIARPNNDTLYVVCMLDVRNDPVILDVPAFDSKYASLTFTAYDHYINLPMATRLGDFKKPEKVLVYSARTEGYKGEPVDGVDRIYEMSGNFVSAVFRVMPHLTEPERFEKIVGQMQLVNATTLSKYKGGAVKSIHNIAFPPVGTTDADTFESNLLEVMQFVFNHVTFDPDNRMDQNVLDAYRPLGVVPGRVYDPLKVAHIDKKRMREIAEQVSAENQAYLSDAVTYAKAADKIMQPKGKTNLASMVVASVLKPLGLPKEEAMYPNVPTVDGAPMNAMNDYVIRMSKNELPPALAFWSLTLYDRQDGFFIPNDQNKYSVGENAGMKVAKNGGIEIYVAEKKPPGVPEENWLPIMRMDVELDIVLRIYNPDLDKMVNWTAPKAEMLSVENQGRKTGSKDQK